MRLRNILTSASFISGIIIWLNMARCLTFVNIWLDHNYPYFYYDDDIHYLIAAIFSLV
jgi:hypothetical protein